LNNGILMAVSFAVKTLVIAGKLVWRMIVLSWGKQLLQRHCLNF